MPDTERFNIFKIMNTPVHGRNQAPLIDLQEDADDGEDYVEVVEEENDVEVVEGENDVMIMEEGEEDDEVILVEDVRAFSVSRGADSVTSKAAEVLQVTKVLKNVPDVIDLSDSDSEMVAGDGNGEGFFIDRNATEPSLLAENVITINEEVKQDRKARKKKKSLIKAEAKRMKQTEDALQAEGTAAISALQPTFPKKDSNKAKKISKTVAMSLAENVMRQRNGEVAVSLPVRHCFSPSNIDMLTRGTRTECGVEARQFETVQPAPPLGYKPFRLCSYNVLCQSTAEGTSYLYKHLKFDRSAISWESRQKLLAEELANINADVFGLQEIENDHLNKFYRPLLTRSGYIVKYKRRTGGLLVDGCLLAVRKSRFTVEKYESVEYFLKEGSVMDRHQVGQVAVLVDSNTQQKFVVANTHLLFNEKRGDIKLGQLAVLFAVINKLQQNGPHRIPVFITGDFNLEPFSPLYKFITESSLCVSGIRRHTLSGQKMSYDSSSSPLIDYAILPPGCGYFRHSRCQPHSGPLSPTEWRHDFHLASAYTHRTVDGQREVSTFHMGVGNPDFIFYSVEEKVPLDAGVHVIETPLVRLISRLTLPGYEFLRRTLGPWPNRSVPSDHIPLVADFALRDLQSPPF